MREVNAIPGSVLNLGYQGENDATRVLFDLSDFIEEYGAGTAQLAVQVPGDPNTYAAVIEQSGTVAVWIVGAEWLARAGSGRCQLSWTVGEQIVKEKIYGINVQQSIGGANGTPPPTEDYMAAVVQAVLEALPIITVPSADDLPNDAEDGTIAIVEGAE